MIPVRSQWGRYNLPSIYLVKHFKIGVSEENQIHEAMKDVKSLHMFHFIFHHPKSFFWNLRKSQPFCPITDLHVHMFFHISFHPHPSVAMFHKRWLAHCMCKHPASAARFASSRPNKVPIPKPLLFRRRWLPPRWWQGEVPLFEDLQK